MLEAWEEELSMAPWKEQFESLTIPSNLEFSKLELKGLPKELKYLILGEGKTFYVIISSALDELQESKLKKLLMQHKGAIGWTIANLKGINESIGTAGFF